MRPEAITIVPYVGEVMSALGITTQRQLIASLIVAIAVTMALKNAYMVWFYWWQATVVARWKADLSRRMMRLYVLSDLRMHMEKSPGTMIRNLSYTGIVFDQYILAVLALVVNGTVAVGIAILLAMALPGRDVVRRRHAGGRRHRVLLSDAGPDCRDRTGERRDLQAQKPGAAIRHRRHPRVEDSRAGKLFPRSVYRKSSCDRSIGRATTTSSRRCLASGSRRSSSWRCWR